MPRPVVWADLTCETCKMVVRVKPCEITAGRRYCSVRCRSVAHRPPINVGNKFAWKGDEASRWAMHKRANKIKGPGGCERCPSAGQVVHHKDENPRNNKPSNLERLCRACHARHHALVRQEATA